MLLNYTCVFIEHNFETVIYECIGRYSFLNWPSYLLPAVGKAAVI